MRVNIVHPRAGELRYEIRGIVEFAKKIEATGIDITWENIGDPVAKGEHVPGWIRQIVTTTTSKDMDSYAYSPTKGLAQTRKFLAKKRNVETGAHLSADNVLFFNGLGDAITKIYSWLNPSARVLGPRPAYPTHSALEGAHSVSEQLTYKLNPRNGWLPNVEDIRRKVKTNPNIAALLIINPDNPTGMVYPKDILAEFVSIAREHKLFLIADEIYANLVYDPNDFVSIAELADDIPMVVMRGLSKEVPWPGSRCGWVEFYNLNADKNFARYVQSIEEAKMTEVCSTTLPQSVLPAILSDSRYPEHLANRRTKYIRRAEEAVQSLNAHSALNVVMPKGAFYLSVTFSDKFVHKPFVLQAANVQAQKLLDKELAIIAPQDFDKRFCYQLMAHNGICVVPLSTGFISHVSGFRMTLLEEEDAKFSQTLAAIKKAVGG
jgi:aspartate/methionine/tyrosine aminotransferase